MIVVALLVAMLMPVRAASLFIDGASQADTKSELEGTWDAELSIGRGGKTRTFTPGETHLTFRGDKLTARNFIAPEVQELQVVIDSKTTPKQMDVKSGSRTHSCIYELQGDTLTIAVSLGSTRPKGFKEADQTFRISVLKLKRRR